MKINETPKILYIFHTHKHLSLSLYIKSSFKKAIHINPFLNAKRKINNMKVADRDGIYFGNLREKIDY